MRKTHCAMLLIALLASSILLTAPAPAHDLWFTLDGYRIAPLKTAAGTVFNSHHFPAPASDAITPERMDRCAVVAPDGNPMGMRSDGNGRYTVNDSLDKPGTYVAAALPLNTFFTKTPDGYQRGKSRKDVENPITCSYSQKFAKALFSVGKSGGNAFSKPLGHAMEIVPLKDPASLKAGDILPVKVLLEGKPARTFVYGTYEGFIEAANTFAYATRTDRDGIAKIKMIHDGVWLLLAKAEDAYPDPTECDKQAWAASLTFEIK